MAGRARSLAATGHAGRRSGGGCVPTLERGNEQRRGSRGNRVHRRPERTRAVVGAKNFSPLRIPSRIVTNGAHDAPFTNTRKRLFVRRVRRAHHVRGALCQAMKSRLCIAPWGTHGDAGIHGPGAVPYFSRTSTVTVTTSPPPPHGQPAKWSPATRSAKSLPVDQCPCSNRVCRFM